MVSSDLNLDSLGDGDGVEANVKENISEFPDIPLDRSKEYLISLYKNSFHAKFFPFAVILFALLFSVHTYVVYHYFSVVAPSLELQQK